MKKHLLFLLTAGILLAELVLHFATNFGFLIYALLIGGVLIALGYSDRLRQNEKLIISLMILPMVRIAEIFMVFNLFWRTFIFYMALGFLVAFYANSFRVNAGFVKHNFKWMPIAIVFGIAIGLAGSYFFGFMKHRELLYLLPLIAFSEEGLFRGLIQQEIKDNYGALYGILISAGVYFVFSLSFGIYFALFSLVFSIASAIIYNKTGNVYLSMVINLLVNGFAFAV